MLPPPPTALPYQGGSICEKSSVFQDYEIAVLSVLMPSLIVINTCINERILWNNNPGRNFTVALTSFTNSRYKVFFYKKYSVMVDEQNKIFVTSPP
jgi:hypothetical protein